MIEWKMMKELIKDIGSKMKGLDLPDDILKGADENADAIFNPIEALDAEQVKIYNEIKEIKDSLEADLKVAIEIKNKLEKKQQRAKTLENFFTSSIELKHDLSSKMWRVNEKTGMVEVFDQERALKEMKEMGLGDILPPNMFGGNNE